VEFEFHVPRGVGKIDTDRSATLVRTIRDVLHVQQLAGHIIDARHQN
jgi:hypothetical protein